MKELAALATLIILLQLIFSLYQVKYYNRFIKRLASQYSNHAGYHLDTEVSKNKFSSAVVAVVSDEQNRIVEAYYYKGATVFSRFKRVIDLDQETLDEELLKKVESSPSTLFTKALVKLIHKKM